jgi:hypothetical protein
MLASLPLSTGRARVMAKPSLYILAKAGDREIKCCGREAQALLALVEAGVSGITSLDMGKAGWAIRLAAYIGDLRKMGVPIKTNREPHAGGNHGRYILMAPVEILSRRDVEQREAA